MAGGLQWWISWSIAFATGAVGVLLLYLLQLFWGWGSWSPSTSQVLLRNGLAGLGVGLGVGIAEELVFRGWLLFELEQDYGAQIALWLNAGFFAIAHYFRPIDAIVETWPQFFGLWLLGLTLVWARRIPQRLHRLAKPQTTLGFAAGLHGGLVWAYYQVDVGDLVVATGKVPAWVIGIGGNPLAGVLGFGLLGVIARLTYMASHRSLS